MVGSVTKTMTKRPLVAHKCCPCLRFLQDVVKMKHMDHHKTFADTYAAPLLNLDYFIERIKGIEMAQVVMNTNDIDTECEKED